MLSPRLCLLLRSFVIANASYCSAAVTCTVELHFSELVQKLEKNGQNLDAVSANNLVKEIMRHSEYCSHSDKLSIWSRIIDVSIKHKLTEIFPTTIWNDIVKADIKCVKIDQHFISQLVLYYANKGKFEEVMNIFYWLDHRYNKYYRQRPIRLTSKVYTIMLSRLNKLKTNNKSKYLKAVKDIHRHLDEHNIQSILIYNPLISAYAKFGDIECAKRDVFDRIKHMKRTDSFNAMIGAFVSNKMFAEAMNVYQEMKENEVDCDHVTFLYLIKACDGNQSQLDKIYEDMRKNQYLNNIKIANALIVQYTKCGNIDFAKSIFHEIKSVLIGGNMQQKNHIFHTMMHCTIERNLFEDALKIYDEIKRVRRDWMDDFIFSYAIKACDKDYDEAHKHLLDICNDIKQTKYCQNIKVLNALISQFNKLDDNDSACRLFNGIPEELRDFVTYSSMINIYSECHRFRDAMKLYEKMKELKMKQNVISYLCLLKACQDIIDLVRIHNDIENDAFGKDLKIQNSLIHIYAKHGDLMRSQNIFESIPKDCRDIVTYTAMMQSYKEHNKMNEAMAIYNELRQQTKIKMNESFYLVAIGCCHGNRRNLKIIHSDILKNQEFNRNVKMMSALVIQFIRNGDIQSAQRVFDAIEEPLHATATLSNSLMSGLMDIEKQDDALMLYYEMQIDGESDAEGDVVTHLLAIKACGNNLKALRMIHSGIQKTKYNEDKIVMSALLTQYAKCRNYENVKKIMDKLSVENGKRDKIIYKVMFQALSLFECKNSYNDIFNLYQEMKSNELMHINRGIYQIVIRTCGKMQDLDMLKKIHVDMEKNSCYLKGIGILNLLIEVYALCGDVEAAIHIFDNIDECNRNEWTYKTIKKYK